MTGTTIYSALKTSMVAFFLVCTSFFLTSCDPPVPNTIKAKILNDITDKIFDIYDVTTGQQIDFTLIPGKNYYLAVNTTGIESIQNRIILYFKHFHKEEAKSRLVEFRLDPSQSNQVKIPMTGTPDNLKLWEFNISDSAISQETGNLQLMLRYNKSGVVLDMFAFDHYNLVDNSADETIVVNPNGPVKNVTANVGYYGTEKSDNAITVMLNEIVSRFAFATKKYGQMTINYLGRQDYPADNTTVAGKLHDYTAWWNSVSHDLTGTDLLPLNPANSDDMRLIKVAWYDKNRAQLKKDMKTLFNTTGLGGKTILIAEAPYWAAGGNIIAMAPIYNMYGFKQNNSNGEQWGKHKDFGQLPMKNIQKIALHEFGHLFGVSHPPKIQEPSGSNWTVQVNTQSIEIYGNIMHQGNLDYYSTDLFYNDTDIQKVLQPNLDLNTTSKLAIPFVHPVGDPIKASSYIISGDKQAGSSITVNGNQVVTANSNTYWAASVALNIGENRLDVSQVNNNQESHPFILYATRITDKLPVIPLLTIAKTYPTSNTVNRGGIVRFEIEAQGQPGLKAIWWWLEKKVGNDYQQVQDVGHWHHLYGAAKTKRIYKTSIKEPGQYKIRSRARDMAYPTSGEQHQSNIGEIDLIIQ